jgi:gamma-glutamyltranspeptidase/glutathione hydrolase
MAPTIVYRDRRPVVALGSPGSNAIGSAIVQVLHRLLDRCQSPIEAVAAPRVHCEGGPLLLETRTSQTVARDLAGRGWMIQERPFAYDPLQGRVQVIMRDGERWVGASDPRRDGGVALTVD